MRCGSPRYPMEILLKSGAVFMIIALALAWLLVAVKYLGLFGGLFTNAKYLLSAHLDYIFMAILNWLVFALFNQLHLPAAKEMLWLIVTGSALNPALFVFLSVKPDVKKSIFSPFGMASGFSFTLTSAGYGWAALIVGGFL